MPHFDLAVVGAGILGLAHALAAARRGKRVVVIDRDARANGASVRNFGFITVTGQERGATWRRALRSRDIWLDVAPEAGIAIEQAGLLLIGRRPETLPVMEAFLSTEMGEGCRILPPAAVAASYPMLRPEACAGALWSPHERRVESREAIPKLADYLAERHGVAFLRGTAVHGVDLPKVSTARGDILTEAAVICPGDDLATLVPDRIEAHGITRCTLQMLRLAPPAPGWRLPAPVMSDLSLVRYLGYGALPEAEPLRRRLGAEQRRHIDHGIHLIAVQSADGSLVVGDSHHYADTPDPFGRDEIDALILDEYAATLGPQAPTVLERWTGTYASATGPMVMDRLGERLRLVMVTSGTGASTGFAIGEETIADLYD